jgi:hypothetical protein
MKVNDVLARETLGSTSCRDQSQSLHLHAPGKHPTSYMNDT